VCDDLTFREKKSFTRIVTRDGRARAMFTVLRIPRRLLVAALVSSSLSRLNPAFAAPASRFESLLVAQAKLKLVNELVADPARWPEVEAMLKAPPLENSALSKAFEAVVDPPTAKDRLMDQAAFIVYYEEVRYNDRRLEPQTPSRRATQNGLKREVLRAVADELAEVSFLVQQKAGIADADDLRMYLTTAQKALDDFLTLSGAK
jgi:hypothetical protein